MFADVPAVQLDQAIEEIAAEVLAEAGLAQPPVDALRVALRRGMVVARVAQTSPRARLANLAVVGVETLPTILLGDEPRPERRQWAVAHEIGESVAHRVFALLGVRPDDAELQAREAIANRMASALLLPREPFLDAGQAADWDLLELKETFGTASHELIARRLLDMPPPVVVTVCDQGRPVWRQSNVGGRPAPLLAAERAVWQATQATGRPARGDARELPGQTLDVRAWPIHEPNWRREIIRTELAEAW